MKLQVAVSDFSLPAPIGTNPASGAVGTWEVSVFTTDLHWCHPSDGVCSSRVAARVLPSTQIDRCRTSF
jgi:hypothetical protein